MLPIHKIVIFCWSELACITLAHNFMKIFLGGNGSRIFPIYKERKIFIYTNRGRYSKHKNRGRRDRIQDGFNLELIELWRET